MGKATQDLKNEHDAILHVLNIVDAMLVAESKTDVEMLRYYDELVGFLKIFADKCHHGKEEGFLFTEMVKLGVQNEGGPIGVMLHEHQLGREYIANMSTAVELKDRRGFNKAVIQYRDLLRNHIEKENTIIFVWADQLIDDIWQADLFKQFEEHEEKVIGHGVHEKLHAMIDSWSKTFEK